MPGVSQEQRVAGPGWFREVEGVSWGPGDMGPSSYAEEFRNQESILKWGVTGIVLKRPFLLRDERSVGEVIVKAQESPGRCASVGCSFIYKPKGCGFDSLSGCIQVRSQSGHGQEATGQCFSFPLSLSLPPPCSKSVSESSSED